MWTFPRIFYINQWRGTLLTPLQVLLFKKGIAIHQAIIGYFCYIYIHLHQSNNKVMHKLPLILKIKHYLLLMLVYCMYNSWGLYTVKFTVSFIVHWGTMELNLFILKKLFKQLIICSRTCLKYRPYTSGWTNLDTKVTLATMTYSMRSW